MIKKILFVLAVIMMYNPRSEAINLGGVEVPKDKFIVYLLIGHSQMAGIITTNNDKVTHPHAWVYRYATTKTWELAKETGSNRNGLSGRGTGGPGMPFLKQMTSLYPDYYFGVITNASPSSTCHGVNSGSSGSNLSKEENRYWRDAQLFEEIITAARAVQKDATLGGILCMLGTIEATRAVDVTVCQNFSQDIAQMATDMRDSLGLPKLPFIFADYEKGATGTFSTTLEWPSIISKQLDLVTKKLSNSVEVSSLGIPMFDEHHFTIEGEGVWARRTVDSLKKMEFFPPSGTAAIEIINKSTYKNAPGTILISERTEAITFNYVPFSDNKAVLSLFKLNGSCLMRKQIPSSANGTISTVSDIHIDNLIRKNDACYIVKVQEANHISTETFFSVQFFH
jgi:hypothetical protein